MRGRKRERKQKQQNLETAGILGVTKNKGRMTSRLPIHATTPLRGGGFLEELQILGMMMLEL